MRTVSDTLSGRVARDYVLAPDHRLTVKAGHGDVTLHRLGDNAVTHNYEIREGEEFAVASKTETRWRVGPAVGFVTVKIEKEV